MSFKCKAGDPWLASFLVLLLIGVWCWSSAAAAVVRRCPKCHAIVDAGYRFCGQCRFPLKSVAAAPPKQPGPTPVPKQATGKITVKATGAEDAEARIDGKVYPGLPVTVSGLAPRDYEVVVGAPGRKTVTQRVRAVAGRTAGVEVALQRATGGIRVAGTGIEGDEVLIDGRSVGSSPAAIADLDPGTHSLTVRAPGRLPQELQVTVEADKIADAVVKLVRALGSISVPATGVEDEVLIDGRLVGSSPRTIEDLAPGTYRITIRARGRMSVDKQVQVQAGKVSEVAADLAPAVGSLSVSTGGVPARVTVDGKEYGSTPLTIPNLPIGVHTVEVTAPDYQAVQEQVTLREGETRELNPRLQGEPGRLQLVFAGDASTTGKGDKNYRLDAKVWLDGKLVLEHTKVRDQSFGLDVPAGRHQLRIEAACARFKSDVRSEPFEQSLVIRPKRTASYRATISARQRGSRNLVEIKSFELLPEVAPR